MARRPRSDDATETGPDAKRPQGQDRQVEHRQGERKDPGYGSSAGYGAGTGVDAGAASPHEDPAVTRARAAIRDMATQLKTRLGGAMQKVAADPERWVAEARLDADLRRFTTHHDEDGPAVTVTAPSRPATGDAAPRPSLEPRGQERDRARDGGR